MECSCSVCQSRAASAPSPPVTPDMNKPLPQTKPLPPPNWGLPPDIEVNSRPRKNQAETNMKSKPQLRGASPYRRSNTVSESKAVKESSLRNFLSKPLPNEKSQQVTYQEVEVSSVNSDEDRKISPNDIVIAVMGVTGSGKSTFIQDLTDDVVEIGGKLKSCTAEVGTYRCNQPEYENVWLIDTPGFDDTERTDADILHEIGDYLIQASSDKIFLTGIIYLHRIQDPRIGNAAMRNIRMFKRLCGEDGLSRTTLVTTFWKGVSPKEGQEREEELLTNNDLWRVIREKGGKSFRYEHKSKASAKTVVKHIIEAKLGPKILKFQQEMDDGTKAILETEAGVEVNDSMVKLKRRYQAEIENLQKELNDAKAANSEEIKQIKKEFDETKMKLQKAMSDHELLSAKKESLGKRMRARAAKARRGKCSVM